MLCSVTLNWIMSYSDWLFLSEGHLDLVSSTVGIACSSCWFGVLLEILYLLCVVYLMLFSSFWFLPFSPFFIFGYLSACEFILVPVKCWSYLCAFHQVADNATLYGVCLHVREIVQRPPAIYVSSSPLSQSSIGRSRFLVSAPRCYCFLTRFPLFELHYEVLNRLALNFFSSAVHWCGQRWILHILCHWPSYIRLNAVCLHKSA